MYAFYYCNYFDIIFIIFFSCDYSTILNLYTWVICNDLCILFENVITLIK